MKNKSILVVSRALPFHTIGGMEMVAWDLARQFAQDGWSVTCLTTAINHYPEQFVTNGVKVIALKETKPGVYSRAWWRKSHDYFKSQLASDVSVVLSVSAGAFGLIKAKNPDHIFIAQAHGTSVGEIKSKWKTLSFKSIVSSLKNFYAIIIDSYYYPQFHRMVAVGETVLKDLQHFPTALFVPKPIELICNGINTQLFFPDEILRQKTRAILALPKESTVVISVSRLHRQKGLDHALKAFAEYAKQNNNAYYLIVGEGPEKNSLQLLAKTLKVDEQVKFLGKIEREQLNIYLNAADVFLFTTVRAEGLPLNLLEALASGLPVIISQHLHGLIGACEWVYGVNPKNSQAIANCLVQAIKNSQMPRKSLLPSHFSLSSCVQQYYQLFTEIDQVRKPVYDAN